MVDSATGRARLSVLPCYALSFCCASSSCTAWHPTALLFARKVSETLEGGEVSLGKSTAHRRRRALRLLAKSSSVGVTQRDFEGLFTTVFAQHERTPVSRGFGTRRDVGAFGHRGRGVS